MPGEGLPRASRGLMSRIRQIKPTWWLDKELQTRVNADVREFYIGLWQIADDAGFLDWDPIRIGAELYPYVASARRERNVQAWGMALADLRPDRPHFVRYLCGHAQVPKMPRHQRIAGKQSFLVRDQHARCALDSQWEPKVATDSPGTERNGIGTERYREVATAAVAPLGARAGLAEIIGPFEVIVGRKPA